MSVLDPIAELGRARWGELPLGRAASDRIDLVEGIEYPEGDLATLGDVVVEPEIHDGERRTLHGIGVVVVHRADPLHAEVTFPLRYECPAQPVVDDLLRNVRRPVAGEVD